MKILFGFWFSIVAQAAISNLQVLKTTATQGAISYQAPTMAACTVEVSKKADYSVLATDVDPALYASANSDSRTGSVVTGLNRIFVIGKQGEAAIETALNGYTLSRALQATTDYYVRVTCGGDTATIVMRTANIQWGKSRGEPLAVKAPFQYKQVTRNSVANPEFADPYTGAHIYAPPYVLGFGYSNTTGVNATGISGCNIIVGSEKGACRFTDATGPNWGFTSGSLTAAIQADDNNFVTYNGIAQEKLHIRLGTNRFPTHGTFGTIMASQNLHFRALTSDATGDGGYAQTCITEDGSTCASPPKRVTLTTSKATYVVCNDSPCTVKDKPGDIMIDAPRSTYPSPARLYSEAADYSIMKLAGDAAASECATIAIGEVMWSFNSETNGDNPVTITVASKNCGASPPQFTITNPENFSQNGSTGTTFWRFGGVQSSNWNYGILIWKESTTSSSTISIDVPLWRATFSMLWRFNAGAGGFGRTCQNVPTPSGYYLCMGGFEGNIIFGIKEQDDGSLDIKNYGFATWRGDQLSANLIGSPTTYQSPFSSAVNFAPWDDEVPGVFYMQYYWNGGVANGKPVLVRMVMNLVEKTVTNIDDTSDPIFGSNRAPKVGLTSATIITPCLNLCSNTATDDYTLSYQLERYSATWSTVKSIFTGCAIEAIQAKTLIYTCDNAGPDSYAWVFSIDLGNGLPIGSGFVGSQGGNTQQVYGGFPTYDTPSCRFCALHTYQSPAYPGGAPFANLEMTNKCQLGVTGSALSACVSHPTLGTCDACPANTILDGYDYSGKPMCSNITLTSSWNGAWGTQPPLFESGDPVDAVCSEAPILFWLMKFQVGDFINHTQSGIEYGRLAKRLNNQDWVMIRGWGGIADSSTYGAKAHSAGGTWFTKCGSIIKNPLTSTPLHGQALAWYFGNDPTGQNENYAFLNPYQNHGVNILNYGVAVEGGYNIAPFDFTNPAANKNSVEGYYPIGNNFAGKTSDCLGNSCEKHPSGSQVVASDRDKTSFFDVHPRLMTGATSLADAQLAPGKTYIRIYSGNRVLDFKHYDVESWMGIFPLKRKDTLTDSASESGYMCAAIVANDCFSGSVANNLYFVNESMDVEYISNTIGRISCRHTQFAVWMGDTCSANPSPASATVAQYKFPPTGVSYIPNGGYSRVLSKEWRYHREAATENAKGSPKGKHVLMRGFWYIELPDIGEIDTVNRGTFAAVPVKLTSVPVGTDNVLIQFGYNHLFQCSGNRDNTCYSESTAVNITTPFQFDHQTLTGVSCASGCTPIIPLVPGRLAYWRPVYRNSGGTVIARGATQFAAVN